MASKRPRFKDYKALFAAFKNGTLDGYELAVDNDDIRLIWIGEPPKDCDYPDYYCARMNDECANWFRGNGYSDLVRVMIAAGIPACWV